MLIFNSEISKRNKGLVLYAIHLPILALLIGIFVLSGYFSSRVTNNLLEEERDKTLSSTVLGDDDDDDDDDDDKSGSGEDDDDEDDDDDDKSGSGEDDEDEDDDDDEIKTLERVQNSNGTFTVTEKETDDDEVEVKIITYDGYGNKIMVEEYKSEDGKEKSRVKIYDTLGNKLSDYRLETEDGKKLELRLKEGETELSRVKFDIENQELMIRSGDDDDSSETPESERSRIKIRLEENNFVISRNGVDVLSKFPLTIDDSTGNILVRTPSGDIVLGTMPDSIVEKANADDSIDSVETLELDANEELEYKLFGTKTEKLLGIFTVKIPSSLIYDAETGGFLRAGDLPFTTRILDLFSF